MGFDFEIFAMNVPLVAVYLKCLLCNPGPAVVSCTCTSYIAVINIELAAAPAADSRAGKTGVKPS